MFPAISTACLYPLETEKSLETLLKIGFRRFEVFANCESEFGGEFLGTLRDLLEPAGAGVFSMHLFTSGLEPYMFFSNYPRRFRDSATQYSRYFAAAASLGARAVVFHGDRRESKLPLEEYCERYLALRDAAEREGVVLAQENVCRCRLATAEAVSELKRLSGGRVAFVLDVKQALRAGQSPLSMCDAMGENIVAVHLSDSAEGKDCLLPGAGTADLVGLCERLRDRGFDGPLIIEVYRSSFSTADELRTARAVLEKLAAD